MRRRHWDLIAASILRKYSGSMKITTHLDYISHCKTASGTNWSSRWTYRVFSQNTRRDEIPPSSPSRSSNVTLLTLHGTARWSHYVCNVTSTRQQVTTVNARLSGCLWDSQTSCFMYVYAFIYYMLSSTYTQPVLNVHTTCLAHIFNHVTSYTCMLSTV